MSEISRYNVAASWRENLASAPHVESLQPAVPFPGGPWHWCALPVASPLGIPAGPLLNGDWICHYANLGFDILVYKTVRSAARDCYPPPNLVPVRTAPLDEPGQEVPSSATPQDSWAVSFGMPSVPPADWRVDIRQTRDRLPEGKLLIVSVVATQDTSLTDPDQGLRQIAEDYAQTARMAVEAGADGIEANFSCPNVTTSDGQLYQQPTAAARVAAAIREAIGDTPLMIKIGHTSCSTHIRQLVDAVAEHVNGLAMTNSIAARVRGGDGLLFAGQSRGICGAAIRAASLRQVEQFAEVISRFAAGLQIVGVGGIATAAHVRQYLSAGAQSVGIATAAMQNPDVGLQIRRDQVSLPPQ